MYTNQAAPPFKFKQRNHAQLELLYSSLVDVRIIEDFQSNAITRIPVGVFDQSDNEVFNTKLHALIDQANTEQTWTELLKEALINFGLTGNAFIYYYEGYFYNLATSNVRIQLAKPVEVPEFMNFVSGYHLELNGYDNIPLEFQNIFHLKTSQPSAQSGAWAWGSSSYDAAIPNIVTLESNYSSRVSIIRDRAALAFLTNESENPSESQSKEAMDALNDYGITEGKGKVFVTTQKLRYNQMLLGIAELELINNLKVDFAKLCNVKGIDPLIFETKDSTYANQDSAEKGTLRKSIVPLTNHFYDKFNEFIRPKFGGLKLIPLVDKIPELQDLGMEHSKKVLAEVKAGVLSKEQALEILYGDEYEYEEPEPEPITVAQPQTNGSFQTQNS